MSQRGTFVPRKGLSDTLRRIRQFGWCRPCREGDHWDCDENDAGPAWDVMDFVSLCRCPHGRDEISGVALDHYEVDDFPDTSAPGVRVSYHDSGLILTEAQRRLFFDDLESEDGFESSDAASWTPPPGDIVDRIDQLLGCPEERGGERCIKDPGHNGPCMDAEDRYWSPRGARLVEADTESLDWHYCDGGFCYGCNHGSTPIPP